MKNIVACSVLIVCVCAVSAFAQNKVTFDNQSGEPALVKLIGPTQAEVEVPNGAKAGADAAAGRYVIKVRYGMPGKYRYSKGEEFEVKETTTTRSQITITLHKVVDGNYESQPIGEAEFGTASPQKTPEPQENVAARKTSNTDIVLRGTLVDTKGQPVAKKGIRVLDSKDNLIFVQGDDGVYVVGITETDEKGAFKVNISRVVLDVHKELHIGCLTMLSFVPPHSRFTQLKDDKGNPLILKTGEPRNDIDLKNIVLKEE